VLATLAKFLLSGVTSKYRHACVCVCVLLVNLDIEYMVYAFTYRLVVLYSKGSGGEGLEPS
jgi:hypothetical protein